MKCKLKQDQPLPFQPATLTLTLTIESEEELFELWQRLNLPLNYVTRFSHAGDVPNPTRPHFIEAWALVDTRLRALHP
jgi:hypothetical protein